MACASQWSCAACGAGVEQCPVDIEHVDHFLNMRRYQAPKAVVGSKGDLGGGQVVEAQQDRRRVGCPDWSAARTLTVYPPKMSIKLLSDAAARAYASGATIFTPLILDNRPSRLASPRSRLRDGVLSTGQS